MLLKTQTSSKPRLKNDTLGEEALHELYSKFSELNAEDFRNYCVEIVKSGGGNEPTKREIIKSLVASGSKNMMLQKTNNFILAGMGLGV